MWPKSGFPPIQPPTVVKKVGRPKKMRRRTTYDKEKANNEVCQNEIALQLEDGTKKLKKKVYQKSLRCSVCHEDKHNKRSCPVAKKEREDEAEKQREEEAMNGQNETNHAESQVITIALLHYIG